MRYLPVVNDGYKSFTITWRRFFNLITGFLWVNDLTKKLNPYKEKEFDSP